MKFTKILTILCLVAVLPLVFVGCDDSDKDFLGYRDVSFVMYKRNAETNEVVEKFYSEGKSVQINHVDDGTEYKYDLGEIRINDHPTFSDTWFLPARYLSDCVKDNLVVVKDNLTGRNIFSYYSAYPLGGIVDSLLAESVVLHVEVQLVSEQ